MNGSARNGFGEEWVLGKNGLGKERVREGHGFEPGHPSAHKFRL
jgi:hypothetical protein